MKRWAFNPATLALDLIDAALSGGSTVDEHPDELGYTLLPAIPAIPDTADALLAAIDR